MRQRALAENDSGLFDEGDAEPSGGKRKRAATSAAAPALGEVAERAHALRRRDLVTGVRVLGAVVERFSRPARAAAAGRALSSVAVGEASDELAELVADGCVDGLRKLFEVGEVVPCVVLRRRRNRRRGSRRCRSRSASPPSRAPSSASSSLPAGVPVWASVRSRSRTAH